MFYKLVKILFLFFNIIIAQSSTWEIIQDSIWTPKCIMCHDHGLYFAEQSGLILAEDIAYQELINIIPTNTHAADDGLELVGTEGFASLYSSFLWEKINANDYEHYYEDHPEYGALMPLGMDFLTNGELEFIRRWIVSGAPETGVVADEALLEDTTIFQLPEFGPLEIPENGLQVHLPPFDVPPQFERELFYYVELDTQDFLYVNRIETTMSPGSHHFIIYTYDESGIDFLPVPNVYRDLRNFDGSGNWEVLQQMQYHKFISGTQTRLYDYSFPDGVALKIDPTLGFDLNSHYANYSNDTIIGEIYNNFHFVDSVDVEHVAEILNLQNNDNIELPPGEETTLNRTYWIDDLFGGTISIFQLWSHAHKHNTEFKAFRVNQSNSEYRELVYISLDWNHPPITRYDPPMVFNSGDGLELEATYYNDTEEEIYYGLLSTDEMMIMFGLYYEGEDLEIDKLIETIPSGVNIESIFPNPFNPVTTIKFSLDSKSDISLKIYDIRGQLIETLIERSMESGLQKVRWNASKYSSGIYFSKLIQSGEMDVQKMILLK